MDIKDSYLHGTVGVVKSISVSADKLKYTLADIAGTVKEVTLPVATTSANGLMSSGDKTKLDNLSSTIGNYVTLNTDQEITGTKTFTKQLKFTVAKGTAPFLVTSNTKVTNLNADKLDGYDANAFYNLYGGEQINASETNLIDLNNYKTPGTYYINTNKQTAFVSNLPVLGLAGILVVNQPTGNSLYFRQQFTVYSGVLSYQRIYYVNDNNWTDWVLCITDLTTYNAASADKVKNNLILKINSGVTEGTSLYTYNGSAAKTLDIKSGTGIGFANNAGSLQIYNSGVRSIATGTTNGTISVNTNGTSADVAVKGLGSAAYTSSDQYVIWNNGPDIYYNIYQKSNNKDGYVRVLYNDVNNQSVFGYGYSPTNESCYITNYKKGYDLRLADSLYYRNKTIAYTDSNITGNAATADKLKTKRKLWGLDFDGSADVDGLISINYGTSPDLVSDAIGLRLHRTSATTTDFASGIALTAYLNKGGVIFGGFDGGLQFCTYDTSEIKRRMTISSSGNIGIGTTTPTQKLDVSGNVKATSFIGNLDGTYVNKLTNYTKATAIGAIAATDSLNTALGKLEYKADTAYDLVKGAYDGDGTIENLAEILKVLEGIKDTETIKAIIGKYLPLTGGTLDGSLYIGKADNTDYKFLQLTRGGHGLRLNNISTGAYLSFGTINSGNDFTAEKSLLLGDSGLFYTYDLTAWHAIIHAANYRSYLPFLNSTSTHAANDSVIYAPTTAGTSGLILTSNGSGAPVWKNADTISVDASSCLKAYTIKTESDIVEIGVRAYEGDGGNWTGSITSMAYSAILAFGRPNRGFLLWCARGDRSMHYRNGLEDSLGWNTERTILDSANYSSYLGYIGYNKVQTSSKSQSLTGISSIRYQNESSEFMFIGNPASVDSTQTTGGAILAYNNGPLRFYAGAKQILTINANSTVRINGKLGIDVNPTFSLHADGAVKATSYVGTNIRIECDKDGVLGNKYNEINNYTDTLDLNYSSSTTMSLCVGGGKVGIGTRTPSSKLDVIGVLKCNQYIDIRDTSNTKNRLTFQISSGIGRLYTYSDEDSTFRTLYLGRNDTNAIVITADGNVSIGKDTPRLKLDVSGNVLATKFITTGGTSSQFVKGDGSLDSNTYLTSSGTIDYAKVLKPYAARPTSLNINFSDGGIRNYKATGSTTEGKCSADAHIIHCAWDAENGHNYQLALINANKNTFGLEFRGQSGYTWSDWHTVLTDLNYDLYLGYIGTTAVQKNQATQALTGISRISNAKDGNLYLGNSDNTAWVYTLDIASMSGTDKWFIRISGAATFKALTATTGTFSGQITSTVAEGTAPFVITSTTLNTNLNADLLDGAQLSLIIYARNPTSANTGTSNEPGKADTLDRTMFWRDNNISKFGLSVYHAESTDYAWLLYKGYGDNRFYTKSKVDGTWLDLQSIAFVSDIPTSLKNPNAIKFKNTSGTEVSYDGSTAVDLTQGIFEAMRLARTTFTEGYDLNTIKKEHVYVSSATNICASLVNGPTSRSNGEARLESITCGSNSWGFLTLYTRVGSNYEIWYRTWNSEAFTSWVQNIHSGNYTDYTVKKDGTGATGTWGISITGNAGSASTSSKLSSTTVISAKALSLSNASWTDTGYTFDSLASGTYAVQITCGNLVASGIMSVYKNIDDTAGDEIPLHVYHDSTQPWRPYLRTSGKKLLISSNDASATSRTVTIKIALIL